MPVSGLVVVCGERQEEVIRAMKDETGVTLGPVEAEGRIPAILETGTLKEHRSRLRRLERTHGVSMVELVYVDYREALNDEDADGG